jgi:hypothetical protein
MELQRRFLPIPKQSFFLFGPRGTGKSTWLRHLFPEALFVDLLQPDIYREMSARPERLRELVLGSPQQATVVVDEVQRVPELLNVVHVRIPVIPAIQSSAKLPLNPEEACHRFQTKAATPSERSDAWIDRATLRARRSARWRAVCASTPLSE